jgi:hypothetical protein
VLCRQALVAPWRDASATNAPTRPRGTKRVLYAAAIETVGNWSGQPVPAVPAPDAPAAPARITVADATRLFLRNRESAHIAPATLRKYRTFTKQFTEYTDGRGYVMIDQFTPADADRFYAGLKLGPRTKGRASRSSLTFMLRYRAAPGRGHCGDASRVSPSL